MFAAVSKNFFIFLSRSRMLNKAAKKWGLQLGASQVVAGDSIKSMVDSVHALNHKGISCTLDHLGEFVTSRQEAAEATEDNMITLDAIAEEGLNSQLSVKLTQLGIDIDKDFCLENMSRILERAKKYHNFVTIDMEDYTHCQITLDILRELQKTYDNVGTVIQAYLFRSLQDVENLKGIPLRLVKGAYQESFKVAYQSKQEIDHNYLKLIKTHLQSGSFTAIATHDHHLIAEVKEFVRENDIPLNTFEFQMLYGIRTNMQMNLVNEGYQMRVYVPYGTDWFAYYMRRLAERPQNITFALRGFLQK